MNSVSNESPSTTIQSATDCFRLGRTINQFRRLCLLGTQSLSSAEGSDPTYSSIISVNTNEDDDASDELHDEDDAITEDDEDNLICEINLHADHYKLWKAKADHDAVLVKKYASLAKKTLTATEAPHWDTRALITKQYDVAKTIDLDVSTILAEQNKDPVLGTVGSWIRKKTSPEPEAPEIQQSKALLRYCQEFDRMCLPLSLFLACFRLGYYNEMGGHMGASKTYNNARLFYYRPGIIDWICALTADCLACQNNKRKPKQRNELPLEESILITKHLFTHQVIGTSIVSWLLMRFLHSRWYTQSRAPEQKPLSLLLRNGYIPLGSLNLL